MDQVAPEKDNLVLPYVLFRITSDRKLLLADENLQPTGRFIVFKRIVCGGMEAVRSSEGVSLSNQGESVERSKKDINDWALILRTQVIGNQKLFLDFYQPPIEGYEQLTGDLTFSNRKYPGIQFHIISLAQGGMLLPGSEATSIVYTLKGITELEMVAFNNIKGRKGLAKKFAFLKENRIPLKFHSYTNSIFERNLMFLDDGLPGILAEALKRACKVPETSCTNLLHALDKSNPRKYPESDIPFYTIKFKRLLATLALGMQADVRLRGMDVGNEGAIVLKPDGSLVAFTILNRKMMKSFLMNSTQLECGYSESGEDLHIYQEDGEFRIKLQAQLRFR